VILQIDNRLTYNFISQIRQNLQDLRQTLKPHQVLVYFSQKIDGTKLNVAYQKFVEGTQDVFPGKWPTSINSNRFLAFDDDWQPLLCGPLKTPKFSWARVVPLFGHKWDAARTSRALARALRPFFESRNLVDPQTKLYGDRAIGLGSAWWFDFGLPAGFMIFRNFWCMKRRWEAVIGAFLPTAGFFVTLFLAVVLIFTSITSEALMLEIAAFVTMMFFGYPFVVYLLWQLWSGREIRQHIAFGGTTQPLWKVMLVLIGFGSWFFAYYAAILLYILMRADQ
jgi:hypothetical protein